MIIDMVANKHEKLAFPEGTPPAYKVRMCGEQIDAAASSYSEAACCILIYHVHLSRPLLFVVS
jgi:hypothetical protein